jgi:hypothetical protein
MPTDTKEQRDDYMRGLLRERQAAEARGDAENLADIDAELTRMGYRAAAPAKRAETRVRSAPEKRA